MWFAHPFWLGLLVLITLPALWWWRSDASQRWRFGKLSILLLRVAVVVAFSLSAAGLRWLSVHASAQTASVIADAGSEPSVGADIKVRHTGGSLIVEPSSLWRWSSTTDSGSVAASGLNEPALQSISLATALLPPDPSRLWIPDHWVSRLDLSLYRLPLLGINAQSYSTSDTQTGSLRIVPPGNVLPGSEFDLTVRLVAPAVEGDQLSVSLDGSASSVRTLSLGAGDRELVTPITAPDQPGLHTVTATLIRSQETRSVDVQSALWVLPPLRVTVLGDPDQAEEVQQTSELLQQLWGVSARVSQMQAGDVDHPSLSASQLVVALGGEMADDEDHLVQSVNQGTGLLMLASPHGLPQEPRLLAEALPARDRQTMEQRDPSVSVVIIIDTSGSMGGARMPLAKQVAEFAIRRLMPHDRVGIVEFYGSRRWAAPLQPASNQIEIKRGLHRLTPGGGTIILPAIDEAYYALLNTRTRFKHVIILTDGGVETGPFREKIERMRQAGITTSTVLVGPAQHSRFLTSLAQWGGGRAYQAPDRFQLPEIVLKQVNEELQKPSQESERSAQFWGDISAPTTITASVNPNDTIQLDPKPTSHINATIQASQPLAVRWRYGRGHVGIWAASLTGETARSIFEDDDASKWLRQCDLPPSN